MIYGWDGASWQGLPDVARLKAEGHDFCIEKCTGEGDYVNPYWRPVRDACRAAGVLFGSYDWVEPQRWAGPGDAVAAARDYLRAVGPRQPGELLCVDFETPEWFQGPLGHDIEAAMRAYLNTLVREGQQPIVVYTAPYFLAETGAVAWDWLGDGFTLWEAAPGKDAQLPDDTPWPIPPLPWIDGPAIHQHQWHATSGAVAGEFDRNRFRGTVADLALLGYQGGQAPQREEAGDVKEPPEGKYTAYVNDQGNAVFVWNMGGQVGPGGILGINVQDLGLTVDSASEPGTPIDRSIQNQQVQPFHDRRQD